MAGTIGRKSFMRTTRSKTGQMKQSYVKPGLVKNTRVKSYKPLRALKRFK